MALTSTDVQQQGFGTARHGYDPQEVDTFLERVAMELDNYNRALLEAKSRFESAEARAAVAEQQAAQAAARSSASSDATEEQIAKAFISAQRSADAMKEEARVEVEKAYREAEKRAREIVRDATAEKKRILAEIDRLRKSCEKFRSNYLSLLGHFQADAKKTMPTIEAAMPDTSTDADNGFIAANEASVAPARREVPQYQAAAPAATVPAEPASNEGSFEVLADKQDAQVALNLDDDLDIEEID